MTHPHLGAHWLAWDLCCERTDWGAQSRGWAGEGPGPHSPTDKLEALGPFSPEKQIPNQNKLPVMRHRQALWSRTPWGVNQQGRNPEAIVGRHRTIAPQPSPTRKAAPLKLGKEDPRSARPANVRFPSRSSFFLVLVFFPPRNLPYKVKGASNTFRRSSLSSASSLKLYDCL